MRSPRRTAPFLVSVLTITLLALTGCYPLSNDAAPDQSARPSGPGAAAATQELGTLTVASWSSMTGYTRDKFKHWISQGNGCDTRDVVLKMDGTAVQTGADCKILSGTWVSPYDGKTLTDPQDMDIDHMVPLADAWRTGASAWTDEQRSAFANDLTRPQLLAVSLTTNRAKGDQDPSQWKPPNTSYWCEYAQRWIAVKAYWKLSVTTTEKAALTQMLGSCT
jgi:Protein of unknown function (DUF1524)